MSTVFQQLRLCPASIPRQYMLTNVLATSSLSEADYDELFEALGSDKVCTSLLARHIVSASPSSSAEQKYSLLLGGLSRLTSRYASSAPEVACIVALAHGIADVFEAEAKCGQGKATTKLAESYALERHPMIRSMYLVRRSAFVFVQRIESWLVKSVGNDPELSPQAYFSAIEPFLLAALVADDGLHRLIRNMLARVGVNGLVPVDVLVPFMVQHIAAPCDASTLDGADELSEAIHDVIDVLCANNPSSGTISSVVKTLFDRFQRSEATTMALRCMSFFLNELSMDMLLPIAIRGMQLGEDPDGAACFDLVTAMLSSFSSTSSASVSLAAASSYSPSAVDALTLATLECVCLRSSFYCQPGSAVKGSVRKCLALCRRMMSGLEKAAKSWGTRGEVLHWLDFQAIESKVDDMATARVLAHLAHGSVIIRLEALDVVRRLVAADPAPASDDASFFALPILLHAIRSAARSYASQQGAITGFDPVSFSYYMRELLFTLASMGEARACAPFVARILQSFLMDSIPPELVGIAIRLLGRLYFSSRKAYASLKVVLLGCDMKREATEELTIEQQAAIHTLVDICDRTPEKGKDFAHMIQTCASSEHPTLAAGGLRSIRLLCAAEILDFEKSWVVISRIYPNLPENDELSAAWVDLIGCALLEKDLNHIDHLFQTRDGKVGEGNNLSPRATMLASVMDLLWEAAGHRSPLVRAKAYNALAAIEWDVAEAVDRLRQPVFYAKFLADETDPKALAALEAMLDTVLLMEHADRRKQLLELKSHVPAQVKQSQRQRFFKLTHSIPRMLLKEVSLLGSGVFVALNLKRREYSKTGKQLCATDAASCIDLLVEPEYIPLLSHSWTTFIQRWCATSDGPMDAMDAWNELGLGQHAPWNGARDIRGTSNAQKSIISNPNIPAAMVACASLQPDLVKPAVQCLIGILGDPLQHQSLRDVCLVLAAMCVDIARKYLSDEAHDQLIRCIQQADVADPHRLLACDIMNIEATNIKQDSVRHSCDRLRMSVLRSYLQGQLDDQGVSVALSKLSDMLSTSTSPGYVLLTMSRLLIGALSDGFQDTNNGNSWTVENMVSRLSSFLKDDVSTLANVRANAGHACLGLSVCLQYQMKHMKNLDQSCAQENAVENELEAICFMPAAVPLRMGCVPFIADMCARAALFQESHLDRDESLESLSTSAIGYLSDALLRGSFADVDRVTLLLSCLARVPRLAQKDWTACLKRIIKSYAVERVQIAAIVFAKSHPSVSQAFTVDGAFDSEAAGLQLLPAAQEAALLNFERLPATTLRRVLSLSKDNAATRGVANDVLSRLSAANGPTGWASSAAHVETS